MSFFEHTGSVKIDSLSIEVEEYRHINTHARHYHFAAKDNNNAFVVAFLTIPQDSSGIAHVLEHTCLCGSKHYPVRDPFFMMLRRSLNTFMNAFTSSDWTAYVYASRNKKDFDNLLKVYLDAVFFPSLNPLDFAQEGHRLELADEHDPDGPLVYKGVVYNEMKGAMSSVVRLLHQTMQTHLFPTLTYHYNSGGDPKVIPALQYDQLRQFHQQFYHPSNAVFMTYGDIPASEHQVKFEEYALSEFKRQVVDMHVAQEQRYASPVEITSRYAVDDDKDLTSKNHVIIGWLLDDIKDPFSQLEARLLEGLLLDNGSSPLRKVLENTALGTPSEVMGLDDSTHEMMFICGLQAVASTREKDVEHLVLSVVHDITDNGVSPDLLEAALHQLEFSQRDMDDGYMPFGMELMVNTLGSAVHGGDPAAAIDLDPLIKMLRQRCENPDYIKTLVRRSLLENTHRVLLTLMPDASMSAELDEQEREKLSDIKSRLDHEDIDKLVEQARILRDRQLDEDDPELLPKVTLLDVPVDQGFATGGQAMIANLPLTRYRQNTNGILHEQVVISLPAQDEANNQLIPVFCDCVTNVGIGAQDYLTVQGRQAAVTGELDAWVSMQGACEQGRDTQAFFVVGAKALSRNSEAMTGLLLETIHDARFDELERIRECVSQLRAHKEASILGQGHSLAMQAAASGFSAYGEQAHSWYGLKGIAFLKQLDTELADAGQLQKTADRLAGLRDALLESPAQGLLIGNESDLNNTTAGLARCQLSATNTGDGRPFHIQFEPEPVKTAWVTNTQVNFNARAYPAVPWLHDDAPALSVLGGFLRNGYLHSAVREQGGAYGGGAGWDADSATFRFFSYRDPRTTETLDDFDISIDWLYTNRHHDRQLEEAILGVIGSLDKPLSPAGEAKDVFYADLHGRSIERRRAFRKAVLDVSMTDLKRVAETYLQAENAGTAVLTNKNNAAIYADSLGLSVTSL